jgi:transcriptional regulator with XRE-family HTH domain
MVAGSRTATAEATAVAVSFELREAGKRLAQARADESAELDRLAALLQLATSAGLRAHEIAGRAGISRRTVTHARNSARGAREPGQNVDARVACALGVGEAKSERALIGAVAQGPTCAKEVSAALHRLVEAGDVRAVVHGTSGNGAVSHYRLTAQGAARLPDRLRQATMSPAREWIVSVASTPTEAGTIDRAAERLLGKHDVSVIRASTRQDMRAASACLARGGERP